MNKIATRGLALHEAKWDTSARKAYKASHPDNFAGDGLDYPIRDGNDVRDAWDLARGPDQDKIRARVKEIATRLGLTSALPDTAQEESAALTRPQKRIGTLPICWLEYNGRSVNGRIYPKGTCDAIFLAAQKKLAQPQDFAHPPTTFVSHEDANGNVNTHLVGGPTKVWQEGSKFWANIDLADTSVAHDMLGLAEGGYLKSGSMRVMGVELRHDRNYDLPLVVVQEGAEPEFMGIDLTTRPGLAGIARIPQVIYESDGREPYIDTFALNDVTIETQKGNSMGIPLYLKVIADVLELKEAALTADRAAHGRIHDHLAGVLDQTINECHGSESARFKALVEAELSEEGKAIAKKHAVKLAAAHDESARQMGMDCEGAYNEALGIPNDDEPVDKDLNDNDQDDESQHNKGEETLTEQEMIDALKAQGYTIPEKKTKEQELQEAFDAKLATQKSEFEARLAALEGKETPVRKTQVASGFDEQGNLLAEELYEEGDYLKGTLSPKNWRALASPRTPWPEDLDPSLVLHELAPFMEHQIMSMQYAAQGRSLKDAIAAGMHD